MKWKNKTVSFIEGFVLVNANRVIAEATNRNALALKECIQKVEELSKEIERLKKEVEK